MNKFLFKFFSVTVILSMLVTALPMQSAQAAGPTELFFSEYIEGSSNNKALEIYNGTGAAIDLAAGGYNIQMFFNGSTSAGLTINLTGVVADGDVFVIAHSLANATILAQADQTNSAGWFNGDDAVLLRKGTTVIDVIGQIGFDPGTEWGSGLTSTADNTLRRKADVCVGDSSGNDVFDPSVEWDGFATDTFNGLGSHTANCGAIADTAPEVASTFPANGAADFSPTANLTVTFSEPVDVAGNWFGLACSTSGNVTATVSGGPTTFTLNPDVDLLDGENCTLTIYAANVTDQDANDPPDTLAEDFTVGFSTASVCSLTYTPAYDIQGSGPSAAITGTVTTQGVVVGDYEGASPALRGFYLQDLTGDGNPATSDGIFVFNGNNDTVSLGDMVRVTGTAAEFQDQTQVSASSIVKCGTGSVDPVDVTLPAPSATYLEQFEGMLVRLPQTMYVTEHFQLGRFGQVVLSADGRLQQPTNVVLPGAPALALQAANDLKKIILDDDLQNQNPDPILFGRGGQPLSASNTLRGGDTVTGLVGVLTYTWSGNSASGNAYRIRPINALGGGVPNFQPANPRPASAPHVGGTVKVVGMNLLNYFNTFSGCTLGVGGGTTDCRGAENLTEFNRQWAKTVAAILAMNPDVIGVNEIENDGYGPASAIADLVNRLNAATAPGTYAYIDVDAATGQVNALGTDAIKVGLIYKPGAVTPTGQTAALNSVAFINGGDSAPRNRASLAQAFQQNSNGGVFIVNINHLKSKGSACDIPDALDGQGNCNQVRLNAVNELLAWFASDPTGTGDPDILLIGDYNSYAMEDPILALETGGFTHLIKTLLGPDAYSYVFDGQWGYLDHALASASLTAQVTGVADYHINADEPSVLDYNTNFKSAGQIASLYAPDEFRVSDHDPVIIGLNLDAPNTAPTAGPIPSVVVRQSAAPTTINLYDIFADAETPDAGLVYSVSGNTNPALFSSVQIVDGQLSLAYDPTKFGAATITVKAADPGLLFAETTFTVTVNYTLQVLHASDLEAGLAAIHDAPNFAAIVDYFDNAYSNTFILSSGDNYIPGTFFNAGGDPALNAVLGVASVGRADMEMLNRIGIEASVFGNHEFDAGTREVSNIIAASGAWRGAQFPYISANLNFATDANLSGLARAGGLEASTLKGKIAPSAIITKNGEKVGLVGITTPLLGNISSPGGVGISPANPEDMDALAAIVQPTIDALIAGGVNKIIVLAHMQQISYEQALAPRLHGVDIILAGGSHSLLADSTDRLRAGDTAVGNYPISLTNADGDPVLIVNTDSSYKYVGRLVIEFDANGKLLPGSYLAAESGAYATDDQGVQDLWGNLTDPFAPGTKGAAVKQVTDAVASVINAKDSIIYGHAEVYLNGLRAEVRTEETNLGNLSADANLAEAKLTDPTVAISIKNGGGIRDSIGSTQDVYDAFGNIIGVNRVKTVANPAASKNAGDISQLDIENSLRFNNDLSMITVSAANLKRILEHSVAATTATATPGQFPQIGGIAFSFDRTKPAQVLTGNPGTGLATVTTEGQRIRNVALIDENGLVIEKIVENGVVVGDPNRPFRIVTLRFLVDDGVNNDGLGGDNYPFPTFGSNRVDMGVFEQTAFSNYLTAKYPLNAPAYNKADTPAALDTRIQNLLLRSDTIFTNVAPWAITLQNALNTLPENSDTTAAIKLADIVVSDDALGTNILSLGGPDASAFELNGNALYLKAGTVLDFETKSSYAVTVSVDDETVGATPDAAIDYTLTITNENETPYFVNTGGPYTVNEGSSITLTALAADPDGDTLAYAWDLDNNGTFETSGPSVSFAGIDGPATHTVYVQVTDGGGLSATSTVAVTVNNLAPVVGTITAPTNPIKTGVTVNTSAAFTDAGILDTHTALWNWGDGSTSSGVVTEANGSGTVKGSHAYTKAGLYIVTLTATDKDGGAGQATFETVIIYNPSGGFVTGGGWFNSPAGAYLEKPTLKGLAITAFAVKYLRNSSSTPSGSFDFLFLAGNLQFQATSFDWLVVDQTSKTAQFQGTGRINGKGSYKFMVWADVGRPDKLRIKIWKTDGTVVYDTASKLPLISGSIIVHR